MTDFNYINYEKLPEHCRLGMQLYIEEGAIPGGFLQAIICNNLVAAYKRADVINTTRMRDYAYFLYNEMPQNAWGDEETMLAWSEMRKQVRRERKE